MYIIVYKSKGYIDAIEFCAQASMSHAIDEVKARSEYKTNGEVSLYYDNRDLFIYL